MSDFTWESASSPLWRMMTFYRSLYEMEVGTNERKACDGNSTSVYGDH
jgi:hypothetical protein